MTLLPKTKLPFNPLQEDIRVAVALEIAPLKDEVKLLREIILAQKPDLVSYAEVEKEYGISRWVMQQMVKAKRITPAKYNWVKFHRADVVKLKEEMDYGYTTKMSAV